jgi:hypothetical protein
MATLSTLTRGLVKYVLEKETLLQLTLSTSVTD